jgi:O-methyltransferase
MLQVLAKGAKVPLFAHAARADWRFVKQAWRASRGVTGLTSLAEVLLMGSKIFEFPSAAPGVVVECGSFKGKSTAILSLACRRAGRKLYVFDSFQGLPEPSDEDTSHKVLSSNEVHRYKKGGLCGTLDEVKRNIAEYGAIDVCAFWPGFFNETMPKFHEPVALAFCDVDLVDSLKTCIEHIWPLLRDGGYFFTHEAHHLEIGRLFFDDAWWNRVLTSSAPGLIGAGSGLGIGLLPDGSYGSALGYAVKNPTFAKASEEDGVQNLREPASLCR